MITLRGRYGKTLNELAKTLSYIVKFQEWIGDGTTQTEALARVHAMMVDATTNAVPRIIINPMGLRDDGTGLGTGVSFGPAALGSVVIAFDGPVVGSTDEAVVAEFFSRVSEIMEEVSQRAGSDNSGDPLSLIKGNGVVGPLEKNKETKGVGAGRDYLRQAVRIDIGF